MKKIIFGMLCSLLFCVGISHGMKKTKRELPESIKKDIRIAVETNNQKAYYKLVFSNQLTEEEKVQALHYKEELGGFGVEWFDNESDLKGNTNGLKSKNYKGGLIKPFVKVHDFDDFFPDLDDTTEKMD